MNYDFTKDQRVSQENIRKHETKIPLIATIKMVFFYNNKIYFIQQCLLQFILLNKGNNKITELRTILQRESQNS